MANKILWEQVAIATLMTTELNSLANGSLAVAGSDYANGTSGAQNRWADFEFLAGAPASAWDATGYFELHWVGKYDGTNYAEGNDGSPDTSSIMSAATFLGSFPVTNNTSAQRVQLRRVPLSPVDGKFIIVNRGGQALPASGSTLKIYAYNEEVQ